MQTLVDYWRRLPLARSPFAHPDDLAVLSIKAKHVDMQAVSFGEYVRSQRFGAANDHRLRLSLLPQPYAGDLARADIIFLHLNPGLSHTDYYGEDRVPEFRRRLEATLHQCLDGEEFPFLWLDPALCWHGGCAYWEGKLRGVAQVIAQMQFGGNYLDALRALSNRIALVQLVPYHSSKFVAHQMIDDLESVKVVKEYFREELLPSAQKGEKTVVVLRRSSDWGAPGSSKGELVVYPPTLALGVPLGPATEGGLAILRRFGILGHTPRRGGAASASRIAGRAK